MWKNVSVGSQDLLCMIWKLITPRKYAPLPHFQLSQPCKPVECCQFEIQPARSGMGQDLPLVKSSGLTQTPRFMA